VWEGWHREVSPYPQRVAGQPSLTIKRDGWSPVAAGPPDPRAALCEDDLDSGTDSAPSMRGFSPPPTLNQLSKDALIALLLSQEARIAELKRRLGLNSSNSGNCITRCHRHAPGCGRNAAHHSQGVACRRFSINSAD
jgi:hypothetical protein